MIEMPAVRYARSGSISAAHQVTGERNAVDLVLAPGTVSHLTFAWQRLGAAPPLVERLSRFARLIRFDKRGTGMSDRATDAPTLEERADDIRAVMDACGSREAVIFGASEGGSIRRELERHTGHEIDTAGDGLLATFDGPARAIRCARAIERADRGIGLAGRAGVHTAEVERAGAAVRGINVAITARICAAADADEVLVSSTVRELCAGSGVQFSDRGMQALKGIDGKRQLFAAVD